MALKTNNLTKEEQKAKTLAALEVKEETFVLVAKIISWKTGSMDSNSMQNQNKISGEEWKKYQKHLLSISKTESVEAVKKKLKEVHSAIQKHQGFK